MSLAALADKYEIKTEAQKLYPYGSKLATTGEKDVKEIAKAVREDIKAAIKKKVLPKGEYSVTIKRYSGGRSLDVAIKSLPFPIVNHEWLYWEQRDPNQHPPGGIDRHTKEAIAVTAVVEAIVNQYNFDKSDIMTDYFHVNFYSHVSFDWEVEKFERDSYMAGKPVTAPSDPLPAEPAPAYVVAEGPQEVVVAHNVEKAGIEVKFPEKPNADVRQYLIAHGFRWSKFQGLWYAKYSDALLAETKKALAP